MSVINTKNLTANLDSPAFQALFKTNPWRHAAAITYNWVIIASMTVLTITYPSIWLYLITVLIIGARMHALAILAHDATHYRFLKNRRWNDWLTNLLCMFPVFSSLEKYRINHLSHHQHLNTDDDPDWIAKLGKRAFTFPKSKGEFLLTVASYLLLYQGMLDAYWFLKRFNFLDTAQKPPTNDKWLRPLFYVTMAIILTITNTWLVFLLFWLVPYFSTFFLFQYIRSVAEHFGELAYENDLNTTRTVKANYLEQFIIAPHNVGYHLEHHLYPGIPFYNLPKVHRLLMQQSIYQQQAHITCGYLSGLLNELGSPHTSTATRWAKKH